MTAVTAVRPPTATATPPPRRRRRLAITPGKVVIWLSTALLVVIMVAPMLWMLISSFKSQNEFLTGGIFALPQEWQWSNYSEAWVTGNFGTSVMNSVIATLPSLFLLLLTGVAAGFVLEVMVWKGRNTTLLLFLAGIMVPGQMLLVPLFISYFNLGLTETRWPFILTYTAMGLPLTVFMMAAYFRAVPREIFEAATIDGASMLRSFFSVGVPMVTNAILTLGLVQFFSIWNDLLVALTFVTNPDLATIQVGLLNFSGEYGATNYGPLFAAICINVFGTLVIFLLLSQRIMRGMAAGAIKG